jgi:hypothetical protein
MALFFVAHARGSDITSRCERLLRKVFFSLEEFPQGLKPGYTFNLSRHKRSRALTQNHRQRVFFGNL